MSMARDTYIYHYRLEIKNHRGKSMPPIFGDKDFMLIDQAVKMAESGYGVKVINQRTGEVLWPVEKDTGRG
jgi:hypothetical protein